MLITRSESNEIWNEKPIEEISGHLRKIQRDVRKMTRYQQKIDKNKKWQKRIKQTSEIYDLIQKHGTLTVGQLNSLTNISEQNVRYRLRSLDEVNAINYSSNTDTAELINEAQVTLKDF